MSLAGHWPPARLRIRQLPHLDPTTSKKIYYYRCLGSDNYRYEAAGSATTSRSAPTTPIPSWDHITGLLADPALIRAEIGKRLEQARTSDPVTSRRARLQAALARATASISAMIEALSEQLIIIDELRARMPVDPVSRRMEPSFRAGVGRPVEHMLQRVASDSRQGGPSRFSALTGPGLPACA